MFVLKLGDKEIEIDSRPLRDSIQRLVSSRHANPRHGEPIEEIIAFVVATIVQIQADQIQDLKEQLMSDLSNVVNEINDALTAQTTSIDNVVNLVNQLEASGDNADIVAQLQAELSTLQGNNQALASVVPGAGPTGATGATGSADVGATGATDDGTTVS